MIRRFDLWLGKRLFVPIIIRICQVAGISQGRFYVFGWWLAMMIQLYLATLLAVQIVAGLLVLNWTIMAGLGIDPETPPRYWLRLLCASVMAFGVVVVLVDGPGEGNALRLVSCTLMLAAEFALTIKTIPPRETKAEKQSLARSESVSGTHWRRGR